MIKITLGAMLWLLFVSLSCSSGGSGVSTGNGISAQTYTKAQLTDDFNQFYNAIDLSHPFYFSSKADFEALAVNQLKLITDGMTELQFYRVLAPLLASIRCGHSNVQVSSAYYSYVFSDAKVFPLTMKFLSGRAYVYQDALGVGIPAGSEIIEINGKSVSVILSTMLAALPADGTNQTKKMYNINGNFPYRYYLLVENPESFSIVWYQPGQSSGAITSTVSAVRMGTLSSAVSSITKKSSTSTYTSSFTSEYALFTIASFAYYNDPEFTNFKTYVTSFFQNVSSAHIPTVIIDMRGNGGGNSRCTAWLFSYIASTPYAFMAPGTPGYSDLAVPTVLATDYPFSGKLFLLVNGASFSATGRFSSIMKHIKSGTFIGEETGGSFVCEDGSKDLTLGNTGIRLHYSTTVYRTDISDPDLVLGRGVIPNIQISYTIDDYINGNDLEMAEALIQMKK